MLQVLSLCLTTPRSFKDVEGKDRVKLLMKKQVRYGGSVPFLDVDFPSGIFILQNPVVEFVQV